MAISRGISLLIRIGEECNAGSHHRFLLCRVTRKIPRVSKLRGRGDAHGTSSRRRFRRKQRPNINLSLCERHARGKKELARTVLTSRRWTTIAASISLLFPGSLPRPPSPPLVTSTSKNRAPVNRLLVTSCNSRGSLKYNDRVRLGETEPADSVGRSIINDASRPDA